MVSEGARPWGRGRSGDCDFCGYPFSDQFLRAVFFKELPSFFLCGATPVQTPRRRTALKVAFPLGKRALRSQEGEGFKKEGDGGEGKQKREKSTRWSCSTVAGAVGCQGG